MMKLSLLRHSHLFRVQGMRLLGKGMGINQIACQFFLFFLYSAINHSAQKEDVPDRAIQGER